MTAEKTPRRVAADGAAANAAATSSPAAALSSGTFARLEASRSCATNPHSASNSVIARVISGLWFASLYTWGRSACNARASVLSGCAWMLSAFATDSTLVRNGRSAPKVSCTTPPRNSSAFAAMVSFRPTPVPFTMDGPEGCVPIHSSACGFSRSAEVPVLRSPSEATSEVPLLPQS